MNTPTYDRYLEYRKNFAVSKALVQNTLAWAEPLARKALGVHSKRDNLDMGERLQYILSMTTATENGGWGELMPVWFKPYERPLPIYVLDNWAMTALLWQFWLDDAGPEFSVENLLKIFAGGDLMIPFLPGVQSGGRFLQHGALPILLGVLWLEPVDRDAFLAAIGSGATRFAESYDLAQTDDLGEFLGRVEFEALFMAEGSKIGGEKKIRAFLADEAQFASYAALFGGLSFSLASLHNWYGVDWESWIFQVVNLDYRLPHFGLKAWAKWLGIEYIQPPTDPQMNRIFSKGSADS